MEPLEKFVLNEFPEGRVVFLSPHDDDAIIGCGGILSVLKERASVIILTDGALGSTSLNKGGNGLVKKRRREARAAYGSLGVIDVEFLGFPDLCLNNYECWRTEQGRTGAYQKLILLLRQKRPVSVFIPSELDFHPDHKATSRIGHAAVIFANSALSFSARSGPKSAVTSVWEYYVWSAGRHGIVRRIRLGREASSAKEDALSEFESQKLTLEKLRKEGLLDFKAERIKKESKKSW